MSQFSAFYIKNHCEVFTICQLQRGGKMCYTISAERKVHSNEKVKPISNYSTCQTRTAERINKVQISKKQKRKVRTNENLNENLQDSIYPERCVKKQ